MSLVAFASGAPAIGMRTPKLLLKVVAIVLVLSSVLSRANGQQHPPPPRPTPLLVTVIGHFSDPWDIDADDLAALRRLTALHPALRWTHLHDPVAYTRKTPTRSAIDAFLLESRDRGEDEIGVLLTPHRSFVDASGVRFRDSPSLSAALVEGSRDPSGATVPLTAYTPEEIRTLVTRAIERLEAHGLGRPRTFCAGLSISSVALQKTLVALGFTASAAAFPFGNEYGAQHAPSWKVLAGWDSTISHMTTPYPVAATTILPTGSAPYLRGDAGWLVEVPKTCKFGAMVSTEEMKAIFQAHYGRAKRGTPTAVCFALRPSSAREQFEKYHEVFELVDRSRTASGPVSVRYVTVSQLREAVLATFPLRPKTRDRIIELRALGGSVFERSGDVVEVRLNRTKVTDHDLRLVADFNALTDLSLEETEIGDAGVRHLAALGKLEWLNLYKTRVGDAGLRVLATLPQLTHLPIGETAVTDAGVAHLASATQLVYLGLRGNNISDVSLPPISRLTQLSGLHIGETKITDSGLPTLRHLTKLEQLWLHDTSVTDSSIRVLAELRSLKDLYVYRTQMTIAGIKELKRRLPGCRIFYRSATEALEK